MNIPHSRPTRVDGDVAALERVLASGRLAAGPEVKALEEEVARSIGRRWAVAASSGFTALHLALLCLFDQRGLKKLTRIAIPTYVCSAVLQAVRCVEGREDLADCAPLSPNLDPGSPSLGEADVVIVPHLLGTAAPLAAIQEKAKRRGAAIIEDCAMAAGGTVEGKPAGAWGDLSIFSLYATKMATCGQGGLLAGDDPKLEARARDLLDFDNREDFKARYNYQLTDLQAALARLQVRELPRFVERRREIASLYDREIDLGSLSRDGQPPRDPPGSASSCFRYCIDLRSIERRDRVRELLADAGIESKSPVFRPLHRYLGRPDRHFPRASRLHDGLLSIPIYPSLTDEEARLVANKLSEAVRA